MNFRVIRVSEWLHKEVRISFVVGDVVYQSSNNCLVVSFDLSIRLWVICGRPEMFDT